MCIINFINYSDIAIILTNTTKASLPIGDNGPCQAFHLISFKLEQLKKTFVPILDKLVGSVIEVNPDLTKALLPIDVKLTQADKLIEVNEGQPLKVALPIVVALLGKCKAASVLHLEKVFV